MQKINLLEIIRETLIGKQLKILKQDKTLYQQYIVCKKKSTNVTDKQFASRNPKFCVFVTREKRVGRHRIFDIETIVDIKFELEFEYGGGQFDELILIVSSGEELRFSVSDTFQEVDKGVFMLKYND